MHFPLFSPLILGVMFPAPYININPRGVSPCYKILENIHLSPLNSAICDKLLKPQPNLNATVGFYVKMTLQPPPPTTTIHTNSMSEISQLLLTRF